MPYVFSSQYLSLVRPLLFYFIGGYIKYLNIDKYANINKLFSWVIMTVAWFLSACASYKLYHIQYLSDNRISNQIIERLYLFFLSSVFVPLCVISCFILFLKLDMSHSEFINKLSSLTFGIYLIHDSVFGRALIWNGIFHVADWQYKSKIFPLLSIVTIVMVLKVFQNIHNTWRK